jgi:hypothetical protein
MAVEAVATRADLKSVTDVMDPEQLRRDAAWFKDDVSVSAKLLPDP